MRARAGIAALLSSWLALAGCPGQGAAPGRPSASDEPGRAAETTPATPAMPAATAVDAAPLPDGLVLTAEPGRDGVALVIQNRSERAVELVLDASVERVAGPNDVAATAVASAPVPERVRLDCAETAARCLSLVPGAELRPAPWPARQPRTQCGSGTRAAAAPGRYRFAVRGCSATGPAGMRLSEPFELP